MKIDESVQEPLPCVFADNRNYTPHRWNGLDSNSLSTVIHRWPPHLIPNQLYIWRILALHKTWYCGQQRKEVWLGHFTTTRNFQSIVKNWQWFSTIKHAASPPILIPTPVVLSSSFNSTSTITEPSAPMPHEVLEARYSSYIDMGLEMGVSTIQWPDACRWQSAPPPDFSSDEEEEKVCKEEKSLSIRSRGNKLI